MFFFKILFFSFLFLSVYSESLAEEIQSLNIDNLVSKAMEDKLYNDPMWSTLLHYKYNIFTGNRSLVDDKRFFLAEKGKHDPKAELEANIRSLFNSDIYEPDKNPACKFPARRLWLQERLNMSTDNLPIPDCPEYEKQKQELDPQSVVLVFPFLYISKPVSMFGHTLLRIDNSYKDPLLAHGVTYNAMMPDDVNLLAYSVKGLFGGYPGFFSVKKYYDTIFEYTNIDKRDIWEYELNLTKEETDRLFMHLWEMANISSDYYFMDENCSYNLLFLLEAARPSLKLTTSFLWEAPSDTVKRVNAEDLVTNIKYRPSHSKTMESIAATLPSKAIKIAKKVGEGSLPVTSITESDYSDSIKVGMLDLAAEIFRYNNIAKGADNKEDVDYYRVKTFELFSARSKYKLKNEYKTVVPEEPQNSHDNSRILVGAGFSDSDFYTELGFRLSFHSMDDIDVGYIPNSETVAADITLRYNTSKGDFKVQDVKLLSIASYPGWSKLFKPLSWKLEVGGTQKDFQNDGERFVPYLGGGLGITFNPIDTFYIWATADLDLSFSKGYSSHVGLGLGGTVGVSYAYKYGKITGEAYYRNYVLSKLVSEWAATARYILPITRNNALMAEFKRQQSSNVYETDVSLSWRFYF